MAKTSKSSPKKNVAIYVIFGITAILFLVSMWLSWAFASGETLNSLVSSLSQDSSTSVSINYTDPLQFSFDVTKVVFDDTAGVTLNDNNDASEIISLEAIKIYRESTVGITTEASVEGFTENAVIGPDSSIFYQITVDEKTWLYWDGTSWATVGFCDDCYNTAAEIDENITALQTQPDYLRIKAFLISGATSIPVLHSVSFEIKGPYSAISYNQSFADSADVAALAAAGSCPDRVFDALAAEGKTKGKVSNWCFTFKDGWSDCGWATNNDTPIHGMTVHVSCSAVFDAEGYSSKGQPVAGSGDPAVDYYSIDKWEVKNDGSCSLRKSCGETFEVCGDGYVDNGEECDDGDDDDDDGCSNECTIEPYCGDGNVDDGSDGEECDDGNDDDDDGCSNECTIEPYCGDGNVDDSSDDSHDDGDEHDSHDDDSDDEECDDGNDDDGDGCSSSCTIEPSCGDGDLDPGEACDDGNNIDGDGCSASCNFEPFCGDGNLDDGEQCDDGNNIDGDSCSAECTIEPSCGDGDLDPGEACDDGNNVDGDGCSASCNFEPFCGDGVLDEGEQCDDGNLIDGDGCSALCETPNECSESCIDDLDCNGLSCIDGMCRNEACSDEFDCACSACGDGVVDFGEVCDDGNLIDGDGCSSQCGIEDPICGNGILELGEQCDDGNLIDGDGCSAQCDIPAECSESCVDDSECNGLSCIEGSCRNVECSDEFDCACAQCGDGVLDPGEQCDDGNLIDGDGCSALCETPNECSSSCINDSECNGLSCIDGLCRNEACSDDFDCSCSSCGDGVLDPGEACDDGNDINGDGCSTLCEAPKSCSSDCTPEIGCDGGLVCQDDICINPQCTVEGDCICALCGNGELDPGEQCDDGNNENNDGCNEFCTLETGPDPDIPPPLVVPDVLVLPTPAVGVTAAGLAISDQFCAGSVSASGNIDFSGAFSPGPGAGSIFQYSTTNGLSWRNIPNVSGLDGDTAPFNFTAFNLVSGDYNILVRVINPDGTISSSLPCPFSVAGSLIFGANQFVMSSQQGPLAETGIVQFFEDEEQKFYIEAKEATRFTIKDLDTDKDYRLDYDEDLKLWTGDLKFDELGVHRLEGRVSNRQGSYKREINSTLVSEKAMITDADTGEPISDVLITIYERDPSTGSFREWNGASYGQLNPFSPVDGNFYVLVPEGQFYLQVERQGQTLTSLITNVPDQAMVTANIKFKSNRSVWDRVSSLWRRDDLANNFPLDVTLLPDFELLEEGKKVPDIKVHTAEDPDVEFDLLESLDPEKYTVLMIYAEWNTEAQEQMEIYTKILNSFGEGVQLAPVSTMSPDGQKSYNDRGTYEIPFYNPNDQFFDDYMIISLPHFFVLNKERELLGQIVGSQQTSDLITNITDILIRDINPQ